MRVGLFTDTYTPDINGVVTSVVTLKKALEAAGHTVFVITNQAKTSKTTYEDGILRLPGIELKFLYGYTMSSPIHFRAQDVVKEMELDIIHAHSEFGVGIFARMVATNLHIPLVSTYHTTYEDYTHYVNVFDLKSVESLSKRAVARVSRMYSKSSQIIIAPSEKTKEMLLGYDIEKEIVVIPTGLDLQRFNVVDDVKNNELRQRYMIDDDDIVFTYIGRIAKEKSVDYVLEGFKALLAKQNAKLMIVGSGPSLDELKKQAHELEIQDQVIFTGNVPATEVVHYYQIADAFVSASITETQGLTFIEALACGLCVFARPDEAIADIIIEDKTGYLFTSQAMFADKGATFIQAASEKRQEIKAAALTMAQRFDSPSFAKAVTAVYQKSIDTYFGRYTVMEIVDHDEEVILKLKNGDHHETLIIDDFVFERSEIEVGGILSRNELNEIEDNQLIAEAYQRALARIAVKDYTELEITKYLRNKFDLNEEQLEMILNLLKERHFIDDRRYVHDKIDYQRSQLRGNGWILEDLSGRVLDQQLIEQELLNEEQSEYLERGRKRAARFMETQRDGSKRGRDAKTRHHLMRQGYATDEIDEILKQSDFDHEEAYESKNLKKLIHKSYPRYQQRYDAQEAKNRMVKQALAKGFQYDTILSVLEEIEHEN